jgi:flagellar biosynthetic protein FliQ
MSETQIIDIVHRAFYIAAITSFPILGVCLVAGVIISIFETITQIHEQALTFVPKLILVGILLLIGGGWMMGQLESFMREVFSLIASL